jgi:hypothetical protein
MPGSPSQLEPERGRANIACWESGGREKVRKTSPRKTRVAWSRLDCLKSNPTWSRRRPVVSAPGNDDDPCGRPIDEAELIDIEDRNLDIEDRNLRGSWEGQRALSRMSGRPNPRSIRVVLAKCGIAYGARALGRRSPHSSPGTGKPSTWRRGAGNLTRGRSRYSE